MIPMTDIKSLKDITREIETFKKCHQADEVTLKSTGGKFIRIQDVIVQIGDSYVYIWKADGTMLQVPVERIHLIKRNEKSAEMWMVMNALQFNEAMMKPIEYWIRFNDGDDR